MKAIIMAAGYGERLKDGLNELEKEDSAKYRKVRPSFIYEAGGKEELRAKPMVLVSGIPLVQHTVQSIERTGVEGIYVITNNKFFRQFNEWQKSYTGQVPIKVLNDGTNTNEKRMGAARDLQFVLSREKINEPTLVISGDNFLTFELDDLIKYYNQIQTSVIVGYREKDKARIQRSACIDFDKNDRLTYFEEKPKSPRTDWICPSIYIYNADALNLIRKKEFGEEEKDFLGKVVEMLYTKIPIHVYKSEEPVRLDFGSIKDVIRANELISSQQSTHRNQ